MNAALLCLVSVSTTVLVFLTRTVFNNLPQSLLSLLPSLLGGKKRSVVVPMVRISLHTPCVLFICLTMIDADLKYLRHSSRKNKGRGHDIDGEEIGGKKKLSRFQFERTIPRDAAADKRVMPLFVKVT